MSEPMPVDLRIVAVTLDTDARGRPITKYRVEEENGSIVGYFHTPTTSRLSEKLLEYARKYRTRKSRGI